MLESGAALGGTPPEPGQFFAPLCNGDHLLRFCCPPPVCGARTGVRGRRVAQAAHGCMCEPGRAREHAVARCGHLCSDDDSRSCPRGGYDCPVGDGCRRRLRHYGRRRVWGPCSTGRPLVGGCQNIHACIPAHALAGGVRRRRRGAPRGLRQEHSCLQGRGRVDSGGDHVHQGGTLVHRCLL